MCNSNFYTFQTSLVCVDGVTLLWLHNIFTLIISNILYPSSIAQKILHLFTNATQNSGLLI